MNYSVRNIYGKTNGKEITVAVPGSKSITARAMLLAALSEGESLLHGAGLSDDCLTFLECLEGLGIGCKKCGSDIKIFGCGGKIPKDYAEIYVGSAGTAARFLPAMLAFQRGKYILRCSAQMKSRPVEPLLRTLESLGAKLTFTEKEYSYPFIIKGTENPADRVQVDISQSSQFLSALLITSLCADRPPEIRAVGSHGLDYVAMTAEMISAFGGKVESDGGNFKLSGKLCGREYFIEPDVSGACYFYAINKILGTNIRVEGMRADSVQGDNKFIERLKDFNGGRIDMGAFSDQALTLAAIAPYLENPTEICNVAHIRRQECDRISAICENLGAMGVRFEERADGVKIFPAVPKPAKIKTFGDHRVAMSFAITGLRADGIVIEEAQVCSKTFPQYFEVMNGLCNKLTED